MASLKLGKKPHEYDKRDLRLEDYMTGALPQAPGSFGEEELVPKDWGMLGNDEYGDCVFAGAAHETMLYNAMSRRDVQFDREVVLSDYAAVTGFDPNTGEGDNGTVVRDALNYRRKTGIEDANGSRHKIGAYVALEPGNLAHLKSAIYLFGAVGIGIEFPQSAMDQFNAGKPWSKVRGSRVEGGHYIPLVAERHHRFVCVTWGKLQPMTQSFYQEYCDEAYALLSNEILNQEGKSILGFDLEQLRNDLGLVGR